MDIAAKMWLADYRMAYIIARTPDGGIYVTQRTEFYFIFVNKEERSLSAPYSLRHEALRRPGEP